MQCSPIFFSLLVPCISIFCQFLTCFSVLAVDIVKLFGISPVSDLLISLFLVFFDVPAVKIIFFCEAV